MAEAPPRGGEGHRRREGARGGRGLGRRARRHARGPMGGGMGGHGGTTGAPEAAAAPAPAPGPAPRRPRSRRARQAPHRRVAALPRRGLRPLRRRRGDAPPRAARRGGRERRAHRRRRARARAARGAGGRGAGRRRRTCSAAASSTSSWTGRSSSQEARARSIVVGQDQVERAFLRVRAEYPGTHFDDLLAQERLSQAELKARLAEQLDRRAALRGARCSRGVQVVGRGDRRATTPTTRRSSRSRSGCACSRSWSRRRRRRSQLREKLRRNPQTFAEVARKSSIAPGGEDRRRPRLHRARLRVPRGVRRLLHAAARTRSREVTPSPYGFHVFKVVDRRAAQRRTLEEARRRHRREARPREARAGAGGVPEGPPRARQDPHRREGPRRGDPVITAAPPARPPRRRPGRRSPRDRRPRRRARERRRRHPLRARGARRRRRSSRAEQLPPGPERDEAHNAALQRAFDEVVAEKLLQRRRPTLQLEVTEAQIDAAVEDIKTPQPASTTRRSSARSRSRGSTRRRSARRS